MKKPKHLILPGMGLLLLVAVGGAFFLNSRGDYRCRGCNVVLISIDTLRADRIGAYGSAKNLTPAIDRLAAEGMLFENMYSQAPTTLPSHMSIMTSLYPGQHRVCFPGMSPLKKDSGCRLRLDGRIVTLAEVLRDDGYYTAAVTGGGQVDGSFGFDSGFYEYRAPAEPESLLPPRSLIERILSEGRKRPFFLFLHTFKTHDPYRPSAESLRLICGGYEGPVVDSFRKLYNRTIVALREQPESTFSQEFFKGLAAAMTNSSEAGNELAGILNRGYSADGAVMLSAALDTLGEGAVFKDPPFVTDQEWNILLRYPPNTETMLLDEYLTYYQLNFTPRDREYLSCLYDAEVYEMDGLVSQVLSLLEENDLSRKTVVIFTSDHGEQFYEHGGYLHSPDVLYDEILRVPLIIKNPRGSRKAVGVSGFARSIDIFPTALDMLGISTVLELEGQSLLPLMNADAAARLPLYAESFEMKYAVIDSQEGTLYKRIEGPGNGGQLFNLDEDPRELWDIAGEEPAIVDALRQQILAHQAESAESGSADASSVQNLDENLAERLRALGYLT